MADVERADRKPSTSESLDHEALVDVPLSFELAGSDLLPIPNRGGKAEPSARWYHAGFHTVTAVVGVGVLGLPSSFSYLGWAGGTIALIVTLAASLYTAYLLAVLHEDPDGTRHDRYVDLGVAILGRTWGRLICSPLQYSVMIGLGVAYTVTAGQSFQAVHNGNCNGHTESTDSFDNDNCQAALTGWIILFGGIQLLLSQVKDFQSLWWVSLLGAAMSIMYSMIAFIASAVKGSSNVSYGRREGSAVDRTFGTFNSFGTIMFAFGGQIIMPEIEMFNMVSLSQGKPPVTVLHSTRLKHQDTATLSTPPPAAVSMMKGVYVAYAVTAVAYFCVACAGYAAFGNVVKADVLLSVANPSGLIAAANLMVVVHVAASYQVFAQYLEKRPVQARVLLSALPAIVIYYIRAIDLPSCPAQVFAQPVYENLERALTEKQVWPSKQPKLMRAVVRSIYVVLVTVVAICLPFFADLMGLIGALGFTPMTFILPCVFWLKVKQPQGLALWANYGIIVVYAIGGSLAAVGSLRQIIIHARTYNLFH